MTEKYKCHCCGKTFKTESGFKKHFCKFQERFIQIENNKWMSLWFLFKDAYGIRRLKDMNKEYYSFMHSTFYNSITAFFTWAETSKIINIKSYMEWLKMKNYPLKNWCNDLYYKQYIKDYIHMESESDAIARSIKYLGAENISIENISPNALYFGLLSGNISNKYLKHANIDAKDILDSGQYNDVKELLV